MVLEEEELTPLEEDSPLELDEVEVLDVLEEEVEPEAAVDVEAVEVGEVAGMVAALTAPKRPTPARAARAAP